RKTHLFLVSPNQMIRVIMKYVNYSLMAQRVGNEVEEEILAKYEGAWARGIPVIEGCARKKCAGGRVKKAHGSRSACER
ncbi:hypothetical protein KI387_040424, partial [Taxus chinensis]